MGDLFVVWSALSSVQGIGLFFDHVQDHLVSNHVGDLRRGSWIDVIRATRDRYLVLGQVDIVAVDNFFTITKEMEDHMFTDLNMQSSIFVRVKIYTVRDHYPAAVSGRCLPLASDVSAAANGPRFGYAGVDA